MRLEDILGSYGDYPIKEPKGVRITFTDSMRDQLDEELCEEEEEEEEEYTAETRWLRGYAGWVNEAGSYLTNEDFYHYIIENTPYNSELILRGKIGH